MYSKITVYGTGEVSIHGVDVGGKATLHHNAGKHLIVKVAGHTFTIGWGSTSYEPAFFLVFKINEELSMGYTGNQVSGEPIPYKTYDVTKVTEFPVKSPKKEKG